MTSAVTASPAVTSTSVSSMPWSVPVPKWAWIIAAVIFVIWVVSNPAGAGSDIHQLITGLFSFGQNVSR
jgi:hypothetical protein